MWSPSSNPFRVCPGCASLHGQWLHGREFRCPDCGFRFFQNVATACGVLIQHREKFLFLERAKEPGKGLLGLPGGFVDPGESVEVALIREVSEETGGTVGPVSFAASFPNRYPFAGVEYHTCDLYFRASLTCEPEDLKADPAEVAALRWLSVDDVKPEDLAFASLRSFWASLRTSALSR